MRNERIAAYGVRWVTVGLRMAFLSFGLTAWAVPHLQLDQESHDFGVLEANSFAEWSCIVRNVGDSTLHISNVRACCGVSVGDFPERLQPGMGAALRVRLNPGTLPGPFHRTVTLLTDDPNRPISVLTLSGRIRNYIPVVEADRVRFVPLDAPSDRVGAAASDNSLPLTIPVILLAGLVDGFNPCAFSIVIFLAGTLAVGGRRRRARLLGGWAFCLASFATYMVMGLGLLGAIRALDGMGLVRDVLFAALALTLFVLAALSFRDAVRYRRLRVPAAITLQLPDGIKRAIRSFAEASWSGPAVVGTGFLCGVVVTLLDSLCTGQVYVPVLALLSGETGWSLRALSLLALYNLAFIAPLVVIFVLAAYGAGSEQMSRWSKRNVVPSKIALGIVFLLLGVLLCPRLGEGAFKSLFSAERTKGPMPVSETGVGETSARMGQTSFPVASLGLSPEELASRNQELDARLRHPVFDSTLMAHLVATVRDRTQDRQWRNDCVQVLAECWMRPDVPPADRERLLGALQFALGERQTVLCGTALLGLGRVAERADEVVPAFEAGVVSVAADPLSLPENRVTALRLAAERGIRTVLPSARRWAQDGETPLLRVVAGRTIRDLGGREGR